MSNILEIKNMYKAFGNTQVIRDLSFEVAKGEFLTVLGSSGCGKTTLLRILCGLEEADSGAVILDGEDVTGWEPNLRSVNTVFQSYALFPHMTVYDNIAYSLKLTHQPKHIIAEKVRNALSLVRMEGYERRHPSELSGGQKQRVAIARAVTANPRILLLDEPLGALDLNLRRSMQTELKILQRELGITFIYITHDQEEALNMSDRIAVMRNGSFVQLGTPSEIYDSPKSVYVARFVGEANILPCDFIRYIGEDNAEVELAGTRLNVRAGLGEKKYSSGDMLHAALRGEKITLRTAPPGNGECAVCGTVRKTGFAGGVMRVSADCGGVEITSVRYGLDNSIKAGDSVYLVIPDGAAVICESDEDGV